ncbi:hypothetical protein AU210_012528 [Fusarium oxysporum f. sp. radicis-cucumerinum]|uniref:Pisatin demethylase n=2 Tax=Fusarium oxysporum TaxID=5507 RepID=A0A2H3G7U2_FUSOX|nr:hypothetical protein AU210_012528 [Fusarium oxysporum f. sp. radicis-cucumerinum]RKK10065.1 hypothetical protein BFJ65_g15368 [Fusarium oxysporum f. sp. cepae]RKK31244.1 hypothetical protein BFJ66_g15939 [Fusarium oxysporum f. sp. cepae]RKK32311.1 hypothetical protein BFJ67_g14818 [Fusarium oxysporum f. sp. cepae]RKK84504.1 hypothetical protein BFJ71_g14551 [Fusarium oxysporum]
MPSTHLGDQSLDSLLSAMVARDLPLALHQVKGLPPAYLILAVLAIVAGALVLYNTIWAITSWRRLRHFDGPPLAGFSYLYISYVSLTTYAWKIHMKTNQTYGSVARIGPNELLTSDPELIKKMGSTRSSFSRSKWYNFARVDPVEDTILNVTSTEIHDKWRNQLLVGYSGRENRSVEEDIDWAINWLVKVLRERYVSTDNVVRPLELARMSQQFTVDSMTKICFGKPFGYLEAEADVKGVLGIPERTGRWSRITANSPLLQYCLSFAVFRRTIARRLVSGMAQYNSLAKEIVGSRFKELDATGDKDKYGDMMQSFINRGHTQRMCELQVPVLLTAGTETTATAIRSIIFHVIAAPDAYRKLQNEIDTAVADGRITTSPISFKEAKDLPYVAASIYEALRMHPPFTGELMKTVPPEGYTISDGRFVPGGTRIGHNTWEVMRNKEVFGQDVYHFRPDRFIEADAATRSHMRSTVDLVFGAGRWQCLGRQLSLMEIHKCIVEVFRNFDLQIMNPYEPCRTMNNMTFRQFDMWTRVRERENKASPPTETKTISE